MTAFARMLQRTQATVSSPGSTLTHGEQLTIAHTAFTALGVSSTQLTIPAIPSRGYFRSDTPIEFVPNQTYVYNNNPSNNGGMYLQAG